MVNQSEKIKELESLVKKLEKKLHYYKSVSGRSSQSHNVIFISDMHVGSSVALAPSHPYNSENDTEIKPNRITPNKTLGPYSRS